MIRNRSWMLHNDTEFFVSAFFFHDKGRRWNDIVDSSVLVDTVFGLVLIRHVILFFICITKKGIAKFFIVTNIISLFPRSSSVGGSRHFPGIHRMGLVGGRKEITHKSRRRLIFDSGVFCILLNFCLTNVVIIAIVVVAKGWIGQITDGSIIAVLMLMMVLVNGIVVVKRKTARGWKLKSKIHSLLDIRLRLLLLLLLLLQLFVCSSKTLTLIMIRRSSSCRWYYNSFIISIAFVGHTGNG